jgi:hypothetical protein
MTTKRLAPGDHGSFGNPADTLRRLVCFVASALDVPSVFVAALPTASDDRGPAVAVWLARDYGLTFDFAWLDHLDGFTEVPWRYVEVMRRLWPASSELIEVTAESGPGLPLFDDAGHLIGHLAVLNPTPGRRRLDHEQVDALLRVAATNVERWVATLPSGAFNPTSRGRV